MAEKKLTLIDLSLQPTTHLLPPLRIPAQIKIPTLANIDLYQGVFALVPPHLYAHPEVDTTSILDFHLMVLQAYAINLPENVRAWGFDSSECEAFERRADAFVEHCARARAIAPNVFTREALDRVYESVITEFHRLHTASPSPLQPDFEREYARWRNNC